MNERQYGTDNSRATARGLFFLFLGITLLLHTLLPSQYVLGLVVVAGAIVMIIYGGRILGLHTMLANVLRKITKD